MVTEAMDRMPISRRTGSMRLSRSEPRLMLILAGLKSRTPRKDERQQVKSEEP